MIISSRRQVAGYRETPTPLAALFPRIDRLQAGGWFMSGTIGEWPCRDRWATEPPDRSRFVGEMSSADSLGLAPLSLFNQPVPEIP